MTGVQTCALPIYAVFNIKNVPRAVLSTVVRDFEMSQADAVELNPWQTDACIGGWHYSRSILENHRYRTAQSMVHLLIDVVSKNGNLLLNIPLPGHGRPDDDEFAFLDKFGAWMALNSEAIYSTRPWKTYGEGPTQGGGSLYGGPARQFVAGDIRFTSKGDALYAIALAWPEDRRLVIKSLASDSPQVGIPLTQPTTTCRFGPWKTTRGLSRSLRVAFRQRKDAARIWSASAGRRGFDVRSAREPRLSWSVPRCSSAAVAGARPRPLRVRFSRTRGSRW